MLSLSEGVTIVQLDTPALFTISALGMVGAFRFAIAPCVDLCKSTAESKLRFEVIGKRGVVDYFLSFVGRCIRFLQVIQSRAVQLTLTTKSEFGTTKAILASTVANTSTATGSII